VDLRPDVEVATKGAPMVRGGQYVEIPIQKVEVRLTLSLTSPTLERLAP
jgi:hypothetical protein